MVELNILQQVHQLQQTSLVQQICRVRQLEIYGCIYEIGRGELHVLSRDKG
jgi:carbonic anhydrase